MGVAWAMGWKFFFMKSPEVTSDESKAKDATPFGAFFKNGSFWAIFVVHFVWNWFYYSILAFLPTFFQAGLGLDLAKSSFLSILPYASTVAMTFLAGSIANSWISSGKFSVTTTRKIALSIAFLGPAACMAAISAVLLSGATGFAATASIVALLSLTFALGAWSRPSLFCSHQDISPKYAGVLLGITNTGAAIASLIGTFATGAFLDMTGQSWVMSLFVPCIILQALGVAVWLAMFNGEPVNFDAGQPKAELPKPEEPKSEDSAAGIALLATPRRGSGGQGRRVLTAEVKEDLPVVLGMTLPSNRNAQFLILASGALVCSLGFAALQEGVFRIPGFKFAGWMTLVTSLTYAICGFAENYLMNGRIVRHASWKNYWILSVLTFGGMYLTNFALKFLTYASRIVFKSAKVVPVMIFATIINGKRFSVGEYLSVAVLVAGIILFTLGDVSAMPTFNPIGVVLIVIALCIDAICSNFEEKKFFRVETPSSQSEVLGFASLIGSLYAFITLAFSGELSVALEHSIANPQVVPLICLFSVLGYVSVTFVLSLIKYFGATETEIVKSLRKVRHRVRVCTCSTLGLFPG
eukprot:scaffold5169_cov366-Prasinococcus_capsulatus_cf.AAC.8